jgi:hypothetical protein
MKFSNIREAYTDGNGGYPAGIDLNTAPWNQPDYPDDEVRNAVHQDSKALASCIFDLGVKDESIAMDLAGHVLEYIEDAVYEGSISTENASDYMLALIYMSPEWKTRFEETVARLEAEGKPLTYAAADLKRYESVSKYNAKFLPFEKSVFTEDGEVANEEALLELEAQIQDMFDQGVAVLGE